MDPSSEAAESLIEKRTHEIPEDNVSIDEGFAEPDIREPRYSWLTPTVMNAISGTGAGTIQNYIIHFYLSLLFI